MYSIYYLIEKLEDNQEKDKTSKIEKSKSKSKLRPHTSQPVTLKYIQRMNKVLEIGMIKLFMLNELILKIIKVQNKDDVIMNDTYFNIY